MIAEFFIPTKIVVGEGSIQKLGDIVRGFGTKVLVFGSPSERFRSILDTQLTHLGTPYYYFPVSGEPTVALIKEAVVYGAKNQVEVIVGIGGGSVLD
ncbi:MAG: iron-containing alcohol dehydrogenase, partial [Anaerolineales bacterium]|nr:iron-containing alcohol dehydrogenase [Anaerolineales bacterium]